MDIYSNINLHNNNLKGARVQETPSDGKDIVNKDYLTDYVGNAISDALSHIDIDIKPSIDFVLCGNYPISLNEDTPTYRTIEENCYFKLDIIIKLNFADCVVDSSLANLYIYDSNNTQIGFIPSSNIPSRYQPLNQSSYNSYFRYFSYTNENENRDEYLNINDLHFVVAYVFTNENNTTQTIRKDITFDILRNLVFRNQNTASTKSCFLLSQVQHTLPDLSNPIVGDSSVLGLYRKCNQSDVKLQLNTSTNEHNYILIASFRDNYNGQLDFKAIIRNTNTNEILASINEQLLGSTAVVDPAILVGWVIDGDSDTRTLCIHCFDLGYIPELPNGGSYNIQLELI